LRLVRLLCGPWNRGTATEEEILVQYFVCLTPCNQREGDKTWYEQRLPVVEHRIRDRLGEVSGRLGDADWLDGAFSAGELMMVAVLLRLKASGMLDEHPNLSAYVARGEARPAYKRAFEAQLAVFTGKPPTG
jgi:glutathione S-transferase